MTRLEEMYSGIAFYISLLDKFYKLVFINNIMDRLEFLLSAIKEDPEDSFLAFALAKEYEGNGDLSMALQYYKTLKERDPAYVGLYYHLGKILEELDNVDEALEAYKEGIVVAKKQADFHALSELNNAKVNLEMEL